MCTLPSLRQRSISRCLCVLTLYALAQSEPWAQTDLPAFQMTGYEGSVSTSLQTDGSTVDTPNLGGSGISTNTQKQTDFRLETSVMTHSYVYHPKFMTLDVGLGVIQAENSLKSDSFNYRTNEPLYNLSLHASVLPEKPLHGTFYFDQINSSPAIGAGQSYNLENVKYGFTLALLAPLSPVEMDMDVSKESRKGSGATQMTDDQVDRLNLNARRQLGTMGTVQANYQAMGQSFNSAVTGLPSQASRQDYQSTSVDTRLKLGAERNHELSNHLEHSTQKYAYGLGLASDIDDLRISLGYRGFHDLNLTSYGNYQSSRNRQNLNSTETDSASGGVTWVAAKNLDLSMGAQGSKTSATQISSTDSGINGAARYETELPIGKGTFNYGVQYGQHDQRATATQTDVIDERVFLTATATASLGRKNVVLGSVKVLNRGRTQLYVQDIDYALTVIGTTTQLRRLITGNILEGEEVSVDYTVDTGGTFASKQLDQSIGFTWTVSRMLDVYVRYADSSPAVTSGVATTPLVSAQSRWYGLHSLVPLSPQYDLTANGNIEREDHEDSIAPYVRTSADLYFRGELPVQLNNNYQIGVRRNRIDAPLTAQNVDQTDFELSMSFQVDSGFTISAASLFQRDTGGLNERENRTLTARAMWRYRRVSATADISRTVETQGLFARDRMVARFLLKRDF